ncbi:hypothetical protein BT63DRAFT_461065 [Microthyrium microscopicum]|uniref:Uncharacterized protein n=1 Tax=Microthyrium microscopicum TaxID=703497 RepID=A0A6A6TXP0_9PEZI|nr:hypothetical protein BT63DRAFT_461065 [Microthyrium microscopicum]
MTYTSSSGSHSYFVPGFGISRVIIQSEIRYMSGPNAIVRPFTLRGRDGFLVTSTSPPLTKEQIEDLKELSRQYERRQAEKAGLDPDWFLNKPVPMSSNSRRDSVY